nr:diaminopimelate decarboxylase [uncultured Peptostreptococcus sp.]
MQLHGSGRINSRGHLEIGGLDTSSLVEKYGSPLIIYDEELIRNQCRRFHKVLSKSGLDYHISYASKAFICKELVRIMKEEDMGLDVVSIGELYNSLSVDFDSHKIHLHGNNKTEQEIRYALESNIGCFVVDSLSEVERLNTIAGEMGKKSKALLRVTPGVEAHTHEFITTGNTDSKFGLNIDNGQAKEGVNALLGAENIDLIGLHFHIGSQIFGTQGSQAAIKKVLAWLKALKDDLDFEAKILNIGGGFGIRYTEEDVSYPIEDALEEIITCLKVSAKDLGLEIPQLWLEPGRSIVGEAGYTLYRVGTIKEIPGIRTYVSIDGGMSDHIRTALYGAKYEVALANRMNDENLSLVTVAGKCCESGDLIAKDVKIAEPKIGDILVVACTGAYHYSMASNYNLMQKPAVVFVGDGEDRLVIKRESLEDLIRNQV